MLPSYISKYQFQPFFNQIYVQYKACYYSKQLLNSMFAIPAASIFCYYCSCCRLSTKALLKKYLHMLMKLNDAARQLLQIFSRYVLKTPWMDACSYRSHALVHIYRIILLNVEIVTISSRLSQKSSFMITQFMMFDF